MSAVTFERSRAQWERSSYSGGEGGQCVEFARNFAASGIVPVRDSKDPEGPAIATSPDSWTSFVSALRSRELPTG
jgi:hypothetical protein